MTKEEALDYVSEKVRESVKETVGTLTEERKTALLKSIVDTAQGLLGDRATITRTYLSEDSVIVEFAWTGPIDYVGAIEPKTDLFPYKVKEQKDV